MVCSYLAQYGEKSPIRAAISACGAYEFDVTSNPNVKVKSNKLYNMALCEMLKRKTFKKG